MFNNYKRYKFFLFILLLIKILLIINCDYIIKSKKSEKKQVENIVKQIKNEEIKKNKTKQLIIGMIKNISDWLNIKKNFIKVFFIFIIIIIILIVFFFLIRYIITRQYKYEKNIETKKEFKELVFDEKFLEKFLLENDFSKAIVYLHNCSIFFLIANKIIYKKNMTNYDLLKQIENNLIKEAFKKIYLMSEKILFDNYKAKQVDFNCCNEIFKKHFIINI